MKRNEEPLVCIERQVMVLYVLQEGINLLKRSLFGATFGTKVLFPVGSFTGNISSGM